MTDHGFDTAYDALTDAHDDARWAFGAGFVDPLSDIDPVVAADVDGVDLATYCLMLADDALVMSHRLQQWLTHAPELEEETALANIALDLLGQAHWLLTRAGQADGSGRDEDTLAFWRDEDEFLNVQIVELIDADFAALVVRLFVFSAWRRAVLVRLQDARDPLLAAVAARGAIELTYHRDYAAAWVVRLGDGTDVAHARVVAGVESVAPFFDELFAISDVERRLVKGGIAIDPARVVVEVHRTLSDVFAAARIDWPSPRGRAARGRVGQHTSAMAGLLDELQGVARAHPGASW